MDVSLVLPPDLAALIDRQVRSGRFATPAEVIGAALRLLDATALTGTARLSAAWDEGMASGDAGPVDFDALRAAALHELQAPPAR